MSVCSSVSFVGFVLESGTVKQRSSGPGVFSTEKQKTKTEHKTMYFKEEDSKK